MKVRSLLLSMCAIVALAGCSKNDDGIPGGGSDAQEAKVILKLAGNGDQVTSKAAGIPGDLDTSNGLMNDLMVFFFNSTGTVITKTYLSSPGTSNALSTTTDATSVAVVVNAGKEVFANVASRDALKAVLANMLTGSTSTDPVTQKDNSLYMSGIGTLSKFEEQGDKSMKATVTVPLFYLSARIQLTQITFNGGTVSGNKYVQSASFATDNDANFTITQVYLMNVQRATHFLPATDSGTDYIAQKDKQYTGGVDWTVPWITTEPTLFKKNGEYLIKAEADKFVPGTGPDANKISNIGHWYTFANTGVPQIGDYPTALVVEVKWRKTKADSQAKPAVLEDVKTLYFTTYFGGGDKDELKPGHIYNVSLALNGSFLPSDQGGSGGGGTTDPTKPTVNSSVEVTLTAAKWTTVPVSKEWN